MKRLVSPGQQSGTGAPRSFSLMLGGGLSVVRFIAVIALLAIASRFVPAATAADGMLHFRIADTNTCIRVEGDPRDDWRILMSTNLRVWTLATNLGVLRSGGTNSPWRSGGQPAAPGTFYRAVRTMGLYDTSLLRTISLTFTQSNWRTRLADGRISGSNTPCTLMMDNGATNNGVGARYRGFSSYTGMTPGTEPTKKSLNLEIDYGVTNADLMGYNTLNLNNAYGDKTILREPLYFNLMRQYTVCPAGSLVQLYINGTNWGVYSHVQQENADLIREYFPGTTGDLWRAPNSPFGADLTSGKSALLYLGNTNLVDYGPHYELKSAGHAAAWPRLFRAIYVLNLAPANVLRDEVETVLAVDRWLWFLAIENVFADEDSYWRKGSDYTFYYEPESGRIHPVEHDGNEVFLPGDVSLSPVQGVGDTNRPVIDRLLGNPELRQRYLAHLRTVLQESFNPQVLVPLVDQFATLSAAAITADSLKGYTMGQYTNDLVMLKTFITNRHSFLINHPELGPSPPEIMAVHGPSPAPHASQVPRITAEVRPRGGSPIASVWLYHRGKPYGRFATVQMHDDGLHGDGAAGDGVFGAATTNYPAGTKVRFYVEARSNNPARTACFAPTRAEQETYSYRVAITTATNSPVVINEIMADNLTTLSDPQGEFDDWIELHNVTDVEVDLTGRYLSDEPNNPRKWQFPAGTKISPDGYLLVWADEDGLATPGLHASFKLSRSGEDLFLTDADASFNAVLDRVTFGPQQTDKSWGRSAADADIWIIMEPRPGQPNH